MCPRTKEQNDRIREARMKQIAAAAADMYLEKGPAMEIRDVALRAGLGYGTVYHYYPNKLRLLDDLLELALPAAEAATAAALSGGGPAAERVARLAAGLLELWTADRSVFILYKLAAENYHQLPGGVGARLDARFREALLVPLASALRDCFGGAADEADEAASVLIGSLVGAAGLYFYRKQHRFNTKAVADMLVAGILADKGA